MVVLQINLDEGLPVVVALVQLHLVELVAGKIEVRHVAHRGHLGGNVAAIVFKDQAVPGRRFVAVQVQAGIGLKMRCAYQLARGVVGPAVQRADDVAGGVAPALEHGRLAVAADVGDQLDARGVAHQHAPFAFLGQGVVIAQIGQGQFVAEVAWPVGKEFLLFALEQARIKIAGNGELAGGLQQAKAWIRHGVSLDMQPWVGWDGRAKGGTACR